MAPEPSGLTTARAMVIAAAFISLTLLAITAALILDSAYRSANDLYSMGSILCLGGAAIVVILGTAITIAAPRER